MIHFEPPYKGQHKLTHFPVLIHGLDVIQGELMLICLDEDGDFQMFHAINVRTDWRYDPRIGTWKSIDDPESGDDDE